MDWATNNYISVITDNNGYISLITAFEVFMSFNIHNVYSYIWFDHHNFLNMNMVVR